MPAPSVPVSSPERKGTCHPRSPSRLQLSILFIYVYRHCGGRPLTAQSRLPERIGLTGHPDSSTALRLMLTAWSPTRPTHPQTTMSTRSGSMLAFATSALRDERVGNGRGQRGGVD